MPVYEDRRIKHRKQELKCCSTCPFAFFNGDNILRCTLVYKSELGNKTYIPVGHTDICDLYPKLIFEQEKE